MYQEYDNQWLILKYNSLLWGMENKVFCEAHKFDGVDYIVPQMISDKWFNKNAKPMMIKELNQVKSVLSDRSIVEIPSISFEVMGKDHMLIKSLGWEHYRDMAKYAMECNVE